MNELEEILEEYRVLTLEMINEIEDAEKLNSLLDKRQEKIDILNKVEFKKEDLEILVKRLKLLELDRQLRINIEKEQLATKKNLANVKRLRQARKSYIKMDGMPNFLDKKT